MQRKDARLKSLHNELRRRQEEEIEGLEATQRDDKDKQIIKLKREIIDMQNEIFNLQREIDKLTGKIEFMENTEEDQIIKIDNLENNVRILMNENEKQKKINQKNEVIMYFGEYISELKYKFKELYVEEFPKGSYVQENGDILWNMVPTIYYQRSLWIKNKNVLDVFKKLMRSKLFVPDRSDDEWIDIGVELGASSQIRNVIGH